jgi:hypothetical protein
MANVHFFNFSLSIESFPKSKNLSIGINKTRELVLPDLFLLTCYLLPVTCYLLLVTSYKLRVTNYVLRVSLNSLKQLILDTQTTSRLVTQPCIGPT